MKGKYHLLVLLFLMSLGSCKKFLDTKPTNFLTPDSYFTTYAQLQFARAGAYSPLGGIVNYENYLIPMQGDEGYLNRSTLTTGPWNYFYNAASSYVSQFWSYCYSGINRANVVLANIDKNTDISKALRDVIRGEMLFLRGYYYFTLVQNYGGVPLKITPTSSVVDVDMSRASVKETYAQILNDMEAADSLVPSINILGFSGAVSKSAVRGLLARVNLHMAGQPLNDKSRYAEASKWAQKVMNDTVGHALNPSYAQIFINLAADKYDIKESLWEVEFYGNNLDPTQVEGGNNGVINGPACNNPLTGVSTAYMSITSKFYNIFELGDNRKWWSIAHIAYAASGVSGTKTMTGLPTTESAKDIKNPTKWRREYETFLPKSVSVTPENMPILRYSDILLMYAEAENEINGPTPAAIAAVNQVRRRAWSTGVKTITVTNGGSGYTSVPTVTFSAGAGTGPVSITAAGTATILGGKVTAIILTRDLTGVTFNQEGQYASAPTITITGGGGTGATATTTVFSKTDADLTLAQTSSKQSFLAAIQDERFREFGFENLRKPDLIRWGIFQTVFQDMGNLLQTEYPGAFFVKMFSNASARDLLMPIPTVELTTNLKMVQNPGWE